MRAKIKEGDNIISAGMGEVFPKGIQIGTIAEIGECKNNLFREVKVHPSVSFSHLEEIFVVLQDKS
jgi:rod shape-determining protein MreC